ncbi:hypothetical protein FQR65_LT08928 [Abscondita terminalis]|nr:hypothetical protein FQR65_LT08928 [Abscondita terminalis]
MNLIFIQLLAFAVLVNSLVNIYEVKQERLETEFYNKEYGEVFSNVYKFNRTTNSLNLTFILKIDLTENDMCIVKTYKWLSNRYRLDIIQFEHSIKNVMNIKFFDVQRLLVNYTTPSLVWPIQKNVYYRMTAWVPDSGKFPPGIPEGRYKQNSYEVKQERFDTEFYDPKILEIYSGVYKYNRTINSINITFTLKTDLTEKDMCIVKGYKWMSNQYRLDILQFQYSIKNVIGIKYFDIGRLLHEHTNPPLEWPVQKDVTYRMTDWIPESSQFPPGMPEGKWKLGLNFLIGDKTPFAIVNWYMSLEYKVKMQEKR